MNLRSSLLGAALLLLLPAVVNADAPLQQRVLPSGQAGLFDFVTGAPTVDDLVFARQVLPATGPTAGIADNTGTSAVAQSRILYLNKNGVTLTPGNNDSRNNRSTIAQQQTAIPAWNVSATVWNATVACMRELFMPFDVTVVEADPGNVPHIEAVFGGSPGQLGLPNNVAGVSPFTLDCSIIENSIVFTFTNVIPADARLACEIQAQEIAHSFGLDHELLASDPMTYLPYNGNRSFKNQAASCGEDVQRPCGINGSVCRQNQNSVALLNERLGAKTGGGPDNIAPTLDITSPKNGATVAPGFTVAFSASDNVAVTSATLYIDNKEAGTLSAAPFSFSTAASLAEGAHNVRVVASDGTNEKSQEITITVRKGASGNNDDGSNDLVGGCSTGGATGGGLLAMLAALGLAVARSRRRR